MAEQPIKSTDIIDNGLFNDAIKQADLFLVKAKELEVELKKNLEVSREYITTWSAKGSGSLASQSKISKEVADNLKNLEAVQQQVIKTEIAKQKLLAESEKLERQKIATESAAAKVTKNNQQQVTTAYDALRKKYNELSRAQIELSVRGRENGVVFKSIKDEATKLRAELDRAEQGAGRFQRNVGNYASTFNGLGNSVNQLTRELPAFAVSMNTGFLAISNNLPMFFDQLERINKENATLLKQGKPIESVLKQLGGAVFSFGSLLSVGVTLLTLFGGKIIKVVADLFSQNEALKANEDALKSQKTAIDEVIQGQKDLASATALNNLEILKSNEQITDVQEKNIKALANYSDKYLEIEQKRKDAAIEIAKKQGEDELININEAGTDVIAKRTAFGKESLSINEKITRDLLIQNNKEFDRQQKQLDYNLNSELEKIEEQRKEQGRIDKKKNEDKLKDLIDLSDRIRKLNIEDNKDEKQRSIEMALFEEEIAIREVNKLNATRKQKSELIIALQKDTFNKLTEIENKYNKERDEAIKTDFQKTIDARKTILEDNAEFEIFNLEQQLKTKESKNSTASKEEIKQLKALIIERKSALIQAKADEDKIGKNTTEQLAIQNKADIEIKKLGYTDEAKADEEEFKRRLDFSKKLIDIIAREQAEKSRIKQEAFDRDIKDTETNIDTQRKLAERGQANTLAFEEKRKRELELEKEEEKQKEIKRQKALAFFKLFASYAEKDPNTALTNALRDTILAEAVSGAFFTGTEKVEDDLKGNKVHDGRDGYRIAVDGSERIMTGDQNKMVGGLSNEELAKLAYDYNNGLLDTAKYAVIPNKDFASNVKDSALLIQVVNMNKEIQNLQQIIKQRPTTSFEFDGYGDFIKKTIENGFTKVTRYQQSKPRI